MTHVRRLGVGVWIAAVALAASGGKNLLTVNVDAAWLKSAIYPVYVDPSIVVSGTASVSDTFVDQAFPSSNFNGWVGPDGASQMDIGYDGVTVGGVTKSPWLCTVG